MCPTPKTARARQSQPEDLHTTRILLEIDLAVGVCGISEASANQPGPAGARAMPWGCTVTVTVGMARMDWAVRDKRSWNKSCGPHRQIRRYRSNADMNATCMTLLEHCRRPSSPNRPSHCSTASVSGHFFRALRPSVHESKLDTESCVFKSDALHRDRSQ